MAITFTLQDESGLDSSVATVWVAGWIHDVANAIYPLQQNGTFTPLGSAEGSLPFFKLSDIPTVTLDTPTNGNDRLLFVAAPSKPAELKITEGNVVSYTQYPYLNAPGVAAPGPFDIFEFGLNAMLNLSAVNGFGLNLRFTATDEKTKKAYTFGVDENVSRAQVSSAWNSFISNETKNNPAAQHFKELLYNSPISGSSERPPAVGGQFFAIADPNDMLTAKSPGYVSPIDDDLATYWNDEVSAAFQLGNKVCIDIGQPENYTGTVVTAPNPPSGCDTLTLEFMIGGQKRYIYKPTSGAKTAEMLFRQNGATTPGYGGTSTVDGIVSQLQNNLVEAFCRGVGPDGFLTAETADTPNTAFSTEAWNNYPKWYAKGSTCHYYAKFFHCSDADGNDSRITGKPPIMYNGSAYGFSMDENPGGTYTGPTVPSITPIISSGTVTLTVGKWS